MLHSAAAPGLSDALVILGATGLVIPLFARLGISPIIGFILIGIAVGPHGLGGQLDALPWLSYVSISDAGSIEPMAEFGIILLLFTIGLELSFSRLWSMRRLVFGVGAAELLGSGALIAIALLALGQPLAGAIGLGLALALSSTALVLPLAGTQSAVGRSAFAMLLFEDLAIVPIIFVLGALAPQLGAGPLDGLARTAGWGALAVAVLWIGGRLALPHIFAQAARAKSPEVFLAASLLVVIVAGLVTSLAGLSPIVGALLAGMLIAETPYHHEVETMMAPFRGLGLGVFMITVGMSLDLVGIADSGVALAAAVTGVVLVKTLVTGGLLRLSGARTGTAAEAGLLMASPSETTLIVLTAATGAGLIDGSTALFWQTVTAIGLTLTPLLAKAGHAVARRIDLAGAPAEAGSSDILDGEGRTVIIGYGRVGRMVAGLLDTHGEPYIAVEADIDTVAAARADGVPILFGDVSRPDLTDRLRLGHARALVLTMDEPVLSVRLVRKVRAWAPDLTIVARARDADHAAELYRAGASNAVPETLESSLQLSEAVLVDLGTAMGPVIASIHQRRDELRQQIMKASGLERPPALKLRDARS